MIGPRVSRRVGRLIDRPSLHRCHAHGAAGFGAAAAGRGATFHVLVAELFAIVGAGVAHFCARPTRFGVQARLPQQEVAIGGANLGAVDHQREVLLFDMLPAGLKAVVHRFDAHFVTARALACAFL